MHTQFIYANFKSTNKPMGWCVQSVSLSAFLWIGNIISLLLGQNCQFVTLGFVESSHLVESLSTEKISTRVAISGLTKGEGQKPLGATLPPSNKVIIWN